MEKIHSYYVRLHATRPTTIKIVTISNNFNYAPSVKLFTIFIAGCETSYPIPFAPHGGGGIRTRAITATKADKLEKARERHSIQ